jgi:hypothetical protein
LREEKEKAQLLVETKSDLPNPKQLKKSRLRNGLQYELAECKNCTVCLDEPVYYAVSNQLFLHFCIRP